VTGSTGDTRSRIKEVALELFLEQGYEGTSLREIAERLGVTKAALYYHFKSKDEIVNSFVEDHMAAIDELLTWVKERPLDADRRREFLRRYTDELLAGQHHRVMRFLEQNQPAMKRMSTGETTRRRMFQIFEVLTPPGASPADRLRIALALFAIHTSWFVLREQDIADDERRNAALEVAYELVDRAGSS
jgi:AcrR family transcriptional regulator